MREVRRVIRRAAWVAAAAALVVPAWAGGAAALSLGGVTVETSPDAARDHLARSLARHAQVELRSVLRPTEGDYKLVEVLLGMAREVLPGDTDLLRRQLEAAFQAGEGATALELTRQVVAADPRDTVAQLRLISGTIGRDHQNADDRLRAYERFVEDGRFDPSVRSRLALDAAMLLDERGDTDGYLRMLTRSLQLDPTHKEASFAAAMYVSQRLTNPRDRLDSMLVHLRADPVDPNTHLALARELAVHGAIRPARRFHDNAQRILQRAGSEGTSGSIERLVLQWEVDGPASVVSALSRELAIARAEAAREIERRRTAGLPVDDLRPPDSIRLGPEATRLMILAADAAGDEAAKRDAATGFVADMADQLRRLSDPLLRGNIPEAEALRVALLAVVQVQMTRLLAGVDVERAAEELAASDTLRERAPMDTAILEGWLALRTDRARDAIAVFEPLADVDPIALFGLARARDAVGDVDGAIGAYRRVVELYPLLPIAAWSRGRARTLGWTEDASVVAALERQAATVPTSIDRMVDRPQDFVRVTAELVDSGLEAIDRMMVRIRIQNTSEFPLSFGHDRTVSSRFLLAPAVEGLTPGIESLVAPEVVDLNRRLRLMPREQFEAIVWVDGGQTGWLIEALANRSTRLRWRAIQGFTLDQRGSFQPGVFGQIAETLPTTRRPLPESGEPIGSMPGRVASAGQSDLYRLAVVTRASVVRALVAPSFELDPRDLEALRQADGPMRPPPARAVPPPSAEQMRAVAEAFAARYPRLSPEVRAQLVMVLPHPRLAPGMELFDEVLASESEPLPLVAGIVTRAVSADDPLIVRGKDHPDQRVRLVAQLVADRLQRGERGYSQITADDLRAPSLRHGGQDRQGSGRP